MHKKRPKICTCCRVSKAKFYLYHSTKVAKARPGFDDEPEYPSVQINSSSPWLGQKLTKNCLLFGPLEGSALNSSSANAKRLLAKQGRKFLNHSKIRSYYPGRFSIRH